MDNSLPIGIQQVFVSHAGKDSHIATQLTEHLRNAGHDAKIDTLDLALGDNAIRFMNDGIANAAAVIILFSVHSADANWQQLEIDSALWNEVAQDGAKCIVLTLDDTPLPPILGPKRYGRLTPADQQSLKTTVEELCSTLFAGPTTSSVVADASRANSPNPFRHLRAEFFEDQPELHAKTFALPEAIKVGALDDMTPCILEGSRGTGKSMLLLSIRARNFLLRHAAQKAAPERFGFYLKLTRGAICNAGSRVEAAHIDSGVDTDILTDIAAQELILQITESLFSELAYCVSHNLLAHDDRAERSLCEAAATLLFDHKGDTIVSFADLQTALFHIHKRIAAFIRRRFIYQEDVSVPVATFDFEQFKRVLALVRRHYPSLDHSMFVVLLDEYENLFQYQQRIVNGLIKLGPPNISVKVAKKLASGDTPSTITGQELQEIHDYTRVPLVYNLEIPAERKAYEELLHHIVRNVVAVDGVHQFNMDALLPRFTDPEVDETSLLAEIAKLSKVTMDEFAHLPTTRHREKHTYYGHAALYRVLLGKPGRHRDKRYAGFSELALLGSGVIRYFQEFLSLGYHLTYGPSPPSPGALVLPPERQSQAVHVVSRHNLTTLSRNVERHGERLKYFLLDLGDCLRHKLLKHTSEPEAARLTIEDPEALGQESMDLLRQLLTIGEREGVFQTKEGLPAFKPKHGSDPQPIEFNICRVYAPVLEISPRLRWRTALECRHLRGLLDVDGRAPALRELKRTLVRPPRSDAQKRLSFPTEPDR